MTTCEDYPCCGHGPPPMGDGGGCPDAEGRFKCVTCGKLMANNVTSAICGVCRTQGTREYEGQETGFLGDGEEC